MNTTQKRLIKNPWTYFLTTFILSWGLYGILIFKDMSNSRVLYYSLLILAMMVPGIIGILFTYLTKSKEKIMDYHKRIIDLKRLSIGWYAIIIGLPFFIKILSGAIEGFSGGIGLRWGDSAVAFISDPANHLLTIFSISMVPFFQELGWRGYAQDLLQKKFNALFASLILGLLWSLWHIPNSFILSTDNSGFGFGTFQFWQHFSAMIFLSIVISWIYINSNRSIIGVVIFHAMINLSDRILYLSNTGETIYTFCLFSAILTILFGFGKEMQINSQQLQGTRLHQSALFSLGLAGLISVTAIFQPAPQNQNNLKSDFQVVLQKNQREYGFPGATAAYILPDGTLEAVAIGQADKEHNIAMTIKSRMLAASIGKTFVAATIIALAQEGRLNINAPISKWLENYSWFRRLPNHNSITLHHLLNHRAGIQNHVEIAGFKTAFSNSWQKPFNPFSPEDLVAFILDKPALFKPGEGWYYTDTGYILIGLIIEKVTGYTYYEEVTNRFLKPLNLDLTAPSNRLELPGLATGYMAAENAFDLPVKTTSEPGILAWNPGIEWTGGGLISNSKDLVIWAKALYEGKAIQGNYLIKLLKSEPISNEHPEIQYGLGVAIHKNSPFGPTYGHGGWIPGYCSSLRYYPDYGIAIVFQINTDIGITDSSTPVIEEIEKQLANVIISELNN